MGSPSQRLHWLILNLCWILALVTIPGVRALPEGFVDEGVTRVTSAVTGTFARDTANGANLLFIANKEGGVYRITNQDEVDAKPELVLQLKVCENGERGIQTIMAHPRFDGVTNRWIYIYYTPWVADVCEIDLDYDYTGGAYNILSRFRWDGSVIDKDSEDQLFRSPKTRRNVHNGGAMVFGKDDLLYIALGEGGSLDPPVSQWNHTLLGKMIRLTENGDIPPTNPNFDTGVRCHTEGETTVGQACKEIFASGLRNPFRFAIDPNANKTLFYINDVGGRAWEEISVGGEEYVGANYGWPVKEGPCDNDSYSECTLDDRFDDPIHFMGHFGNGSAFVGAAFVPDGIWPLPPSTYIFMDFVGGIISLLKKNSTGGCRDCVPPISSYYNETFHEWGHPTDLWFGPYKDTQALYYITRKGHLPVRRIRFTGTLNRSPVASIAASTLEGEHPLTVEFDATNSSDPDPDEVLSYEWDFADGSEPSTDIITSHTFKRKGMFVVKLTVTDSKGLKGLAFVEIMVGKKPLVNMISPPEGATFAVGETFPFVATATDGESGLPMVEDSHFVWEMRQHHDDHWHPYLAPTTGNNFTSLPAPSPEDFLASTNSYLEIRLVVTDDDGVFTTISRDVMPRKTNITFTSEPVEEVKLLVDNFIVRTPEVVVTWENHPLKLSIDEVPPNYEFGYWSDGGEREHSIIVPNKTDNMERFPLAFKVTWNPKLIPKVVDCSIGSSNEGPCSMCMGHCVTDDDCSGELICYEKGENETTVPGCGGNDYSRTNWCIVDHYAPTPAPTPVPTSTAPTMRPSMSPLIEDGGVIDDVDSSANQLTSGFALIVFSLVSFGTMASILV